MWSTPYTVSIWVIASSFNLCIHSKEILCLCKIIYLLIIHLTHRTETLLIECSQVVEMLANNSVSPYHFRKEKCTVEFSFHYATCEECLHHLSQLHRASSLATKDQQEMIEAIVHSRYSRVMFDPCWLEDLHETILFESRVIQVKEFVSLFFLTHLS